MSVESKVIAYDPSVDERHDFAWALEQLWKGKEVRLAEWNADIRIRMDKQNWKFINVVSGGTWIPHAVTASAKNWELYEPDKVTVEHEPANMRMKKHYQVTDYTVLARIADEVLEILRKHGIRRREVQIVFEGVKEKLDSDKVD